MPSRKSGGARQVEAKHLERDAKRPKGWAARQRRAYQWAIRGKEGLARVVAALQWAQDWSAKDPGPPPEHTREQVVRAGQALGKVLDPARQITELWEARRKDLEVIESLKAKLRAARQSPGDQGEAGPGMGH